MTRSGHKGEQLHFDLEIEKIIHVLWKVINQQNRPETEETSTSTNHSSIEFTKIPAEPETT